MFQAILYIIGACTIAFILLIKFGTKPYPKEWEEKENREFEKKIKEYNQRKSQN